jgi:hypothetical protein
MTPEAKTSRPFRHPGSGRDGDAGAAEAVPESGSLGSQSRVAELTL